MNRWVTPVVVLLAALCVAAAISLRSCGGGRSADDGFALALDPARISAIRIGTGGDVYELKRKGSAWQLSGGKLRDRADPAAVAGLLKEASALIYYDRISQGEIRSRDDLSEFGLKAPKRWLEFEDRRKHRILFGKESVVEGRVYARLEGAREIFLIDDALARATAEGFDNLRDRRLIDLEEGQVDRIQIRRAEGELELLRGPGGWQIVKPFSAPADSRIVTDFLNHTLGMRLSGFVGDDTGDLGIYGIEEGKLEIVVYAEGRSRPLVLRFGREQDGAILAQFTPRDSIVRLPVEARALISIAPDDFRDRRLLTVNPDTVDLIRVGDGAESFDIRRSGGRWEVHSDAGVRPASPGAVQRLFTILGETIVSEYRREPPSSSVPARTIQFFSVLSENTPEAASGEYPVAGVSIREDGTGSALAVMDGGVGSMVVPADILDTIPPRADAWALPVAP